MQELCSFIFVLFASKYMEVIMCSLSLIDEVLCTNLLVNQYTVFT